MSTNAEGDNRFDERYATACVDYFQFAWARLPQEKKEGLKIKIQFWGGLGYPTKNIIAQILINEFKSPYIEEGLKCYDWIKSQEIKKQVIEKILECICPEHKNPR